MENINDIKDKIDSLFNFNPSDPNNNITIENQISALEGIKNEIVSIDKKEIKIKTIEEKEFIQESLKSLVTVSVETLKKYAENLRVGSPATYGISFSEILNSVTLLIKELREFAKMIHDLEILHGPEMIEQEQKQEKPLMLSGKDLADFVSQIKKNSELNSIDMKFDVADAKFSQVK